MNHNEQEFKRDLASVLNKHGIDNDTDVPDYILAQYIIGHIDTLRLMIYRRDKWFGFVPFANNHKVLDGEKKEVG